MLLKNSLRRQPVSFLVIEKMVLRGLFRLLIFQMMTRLRADPPFLVQLCQLPEASERSQLYLCCYSFLSQFLVQLYRTIGHRQKVKEASCTTLFGLISSGCIGYRKQV
ncbi:hypothetical protein HRI_001821700 [Hibiscus trionum]|uniref:Uncharacterized protein n=1 Tax=Hibiscus trionum TaxID=183268 RepID=A0A9W7HP64_HIBTR|nr:hypothetical protein HRI_001821700 [Hibiscus trionum]